MNIIVQTSSAQSAVKLRTQLQNAAGFILTFAIVAPVVIFAVETVSGAGKVSRDVIDPVFPARTIDSAAVEFTVNAAFELTTAIF